MRTLFPVTLEDLEREWNLRKRGRRKERTVLAVVIVIFLSLVAVGAYYFASVGGSNAT